jgi:hypothetical protein
VPSKHMGRFAAADMPQDILAGIGAVVAQWSYLAFQMTVILRIGHRLSKESQRALLVGAEVGVLCAHLRTVAATDFWLKDEQIRKDIRKLADDIQRASDTRNAYAHGVFGYFIGKAGGPEEEKFVRFLMKSAEHRVSPGAEEVSAETLKPHADAALRLWERAQAITQRLKGKA